MALNYPDMKPMTAGQHELTVTSYREYEASTGTPMLDVFLRSEDGAKMRHGFAMTQDGKQSFQSFISVILSPREMHDFSYDRLVGKSFIGVVIDKRGYWRVARWLPLSATKPLRRKEPVVAREEEPVFDQDEELDRLF